MPPPATFSQYNCFIGNLQTTHGAIWLSLNSAIKQRFLFLDPISLSSDEEESGDNVRVRRAEENSKQRGQFGLSTLCE